MLVSENILRGITVRLPSKNFNLLLIEDNKVIQKCTEVFLKGEHIIFKASNYLEAFTILEHNDIHFVIVDYHLDGSIADGATIGSQLNNMGIYYIYYSGVPNLRKLVDLTAKYCLGFVSKTSDRSRAKLRQYLLIAKQLKGKEKYERILDSYRSE